MQDIQAVLRSARDWDGTRVRKDLAPVAVATSIVQDESGLSRQTDS